MRNIIALALLAASFPLLAEAKTIKFPSEKPIASITIPDSWEPEETESGVQGTSPDSAVYLSADVASSRSIEKVSGDAVDSLPRTASPSIRRPRRTRRSPR